MIESGNDQNYATIGCMIMQRGDDEPVPAFRARARNTALEVGADILILEKLEWVWVDDDIARVGRAGAAPDIAPAVLFLCSDGARWVNGANLPVDGGLEASINASVLGF